MRVLIGRSNLRRPIQTYQIRDFLYAAAHVNVSFCRAQHLRVDITLISKYYAETVHIAGRNTCRFLRAIGRLVCQAIVQPRQN